MSGKLLRLNKTITKAELKKFMTWFLRNYGSVAAVQFLEEIKDLGLKFSTLSGLSLSLEDLKIPQFKRDLLIHLAKKFKRAQTRIKSGRGNFLDKIRRVNLIWNNINTRIEDEIKKSFKQSGPLQPVYMMVFSGARGNFTQVKQLVGMRGFFANSQGVVQKYPVKNSLSEGLTIAEYFTTCYGARKGIIDTALKTADAGYLTRRLVYAAQLEIIKKANCFSKKAELVLVKIKKKVEYDLIEKKLLGRVIAQDIYDLKTKKIIASKGQDICPYIIKKIIQLKKVYIRTTFNCKLHNGLCQLCYGWDLSSGHIIDLGESVGIVAAQSIGEPGTQLTMRTFHTGGVFIAKPTMKHDQTSKNFLRNKKYFKNRIKNFIYSPFVGIANYTIKNGKKLITKFGENFFLTLKKKKITISQNKMIKITLKVPKYTMLFFKPNDKVFQRQIIAKLNKIKKKYGFKKLVSKKFKKEKTVSLMRGLIEFEKTKNQINNKLQFNKQFRFWLIKGNIVSYKLFLEHFTNAKNKSFFLNFNFNFNFKKKKMLNERNKTLSFIKINYQNFNKLLHINEKYNKAIYKQREYIILKNNSETKEIFTTDNDEKWIEINDKNTIIQKKLGQIILKNNNLSDAIKNNYTCQIVEVRKNKICITRRKYFFAQGKKNIEIIKDNDLLSKKFAKNKKMFSKSQKNEDIIQGLKRIEQIFEARKTDDQENLNDNLNVVLKNEFVALAGKYTNSTAVQKAFEKIRNMIIERIQSIYQSQNVNIADKHLEIIVKQMTSKALILSSGDSQLLSGEVVSVNRIEKINKKLKNKVRYEPILLGISKAALTNPSFLTQASFQETTRILARSAIEGKVDWLYGLKENLMLGNLIPAGTGNKNL